MLHRRRILFGTVAALQLLAGCASSAPSSATALPVGVAGSYVASGVFEEGDILDIDFLDTQNYSLDRSSGSEDVYPETGTYTFNATSGVVTLTASDGTVTTLPFVPDGIGDAGVTLSATPLHVLGGTKLVNPGGSLNGQPMNILPVCSATSGSNSFRSTQPSCQALTAQKDGGTALVGDSDCPAALFAPFVNGSSSTPFATIKTVKNASVTAEYVPHLAALKPVPSPPECFIDMNNVVDAITGKTLGKNVKISEHFTLAQLTQKGSTDEFVLLDNEAVRALEAFISEYPSAAGQITSAFRGPYAQENVCEHSSLGCGAISCCVGPGGQSGKWVPQPPLGSPGHNCKVTCALASRHLFGRAFDLPSAYLTTTYKRAACNAGFGFIYNESNHLHIDTSVSPPNCQQIK